MSPHSKWVASFMAQTSVEIEGVFGLSECLHFRVYLETLEVIIEGKWSMYRIFLLCITQSRQVTCGLQAFSQHYDQLIMFYCSRPCWMYSKGIPPWCNIPQSSNIASFSLAKPTLPPVNHSERAEIDLLPVHPPNACVAQPVIRDGWGEENSLPAKSPRPVFWRHGNKGKLWIRS